jgi:oxygen-independent coproporphyrinogen-3 oxidase
MTADDRIRGVVIQEIMCQSRLDFAGLSRQLGIDFRTYFDAEWPQLQRLHQDGLLDSFNETGLVVSGRGRLLLRAIAMTFDRYLAEARVPQDLLQII